MSLPAGSYQPWSMTFIDAGNETSNFSGWSALITAANHDAQLALWDTLLIATQAIALGDLTKAVYDKEILYNIGAVPTNGAARETKLLVQYSDTTNGQKLTATVPTLDPTIPDYVVNANARDVILLDAPDEIVDFIAAFEAFARPPLNPTHVSAVRGLRVVGRNT